MLRLALFAGPTDLNRSPTATDLVASSCRLLSRRHGNKPPVPSLILELHVPGHQRVQRIVLALPNVDARLVLRAALPHQNRSSIHKLPAEALHTQPLAVRIPPVCRRPAALLISVASPFFFFPLSSGGGGPFFFWPTPYEKKLGGARGGEGRIFFFSLQHPTA